MDMVLSIDIAGAVRWGQALGAAPAYLLAIPSPVAFWVQAVGLPLLGFPLVFFSFPPPPPLGPRFLGGWLCPGIPLAP